MSWRLMLVNLFDAVGLIVGYEKFSRWGKWREELTRWAGRTFKL